MMHANYGHAGQARIPVADWNRTNHCTLSAILGKTGSDVATAFAVECMLPLNNSCSDRADAADLDDTIDLRCAIEIAGTTSPVYDARLGGGIRLIESIKASYFGGCYFSSPTHLKRLPANRHLQKL